MARFLVSTELLVDFLHRGASQALATIPVRDLAVSALSFALVLAEVEADRTLTPASRQQWRSNVLGFRQALRAQGGQITDVSERTLEKWGEIWNLQLFHVYSQAEGPVEMSSEERMVVATALTNGLIYLTPDRDWNAEIEDKLQVAFQVA